MRRCAGRFAIVLMAVGVCGAGTTQPADLKEVPEKWSGGTSLVYEEQGIFLGDTRLSVDGGGRAAVVRSKYGRLDKEIPAGIYVATLSAEELAGLVGILRKHDFTRKHDGPPITDGILVTTAVTVDGAVMRSRLEEGGNKQDAALTDLRDGMRKVIVRVVQESSKRPAEETLAKWLEGMEIVEVRFNGPADDKEKLDDLMGAVKGWAVRFAYTPGNAKAASSASLCLKVTPENVNRLQALREEMEKRGFELEGRSLRAWKLEGKGR